MDAAKIFHLKVANKVSLQQVYMPFLVGGGIFVPTQEPYDFGDLVFLLLDLPDDLTCCAVIGRVAWVLPNTAFTQRNPAGIGFEFVESENKIKARIENLLAGELDNPATTLTL